MMVPNPLAEIDSYNNQMSISQVARFFERQGMDITISSIHYYIRAGLIPPPAVKKFGKNHLYLLTFIYNLRNYFTLDELKSLLTPMRELDQAELREIYRHYRDFLRFAYDHAAAQAAGLDESDQGGLLEKLMLMAFSGIFKELANKITPL